MQFIKQLWLSLRSNPFFVTAWTLFVGALGEQFLRLANSGSFDFTAKGIEEMVTAAAMTTGIALVHLYIPAQGTNPNAGK